MRITHLIASMDPAQGGPPVVVQHLAEAQASLGHEVVIATESVGDQSTQALLGQGEMTGLRLQMLPVHRLTDLIRTGSHALEECVTTSDVLHCHGVWEPVIFLGAKIARNRRIPYVVAPHGMLDPWSLQQKRLKKTLALTFRYRAMLSAASAIHVLNEDEGRLIEPLRILAPRVVIPNGIARADLDQSLDCARFQQHPLGPGARPYVLFLSRLHYKKGLDYLADAFAQIAPRYPDLLLVVVGPDGGAEEPFRRQIEQLGLTARVRLPGSLFGPDKWSAIAGARAFCLPSRQEGFSVAILEAMACRVPVVVSDACHFPEVAKVGAGYVVPLHADAVAGALDQVLADSAQAKAIGEAGRRLVEDRFTWPAVAAQSIEVYERLVNGRSVG